MTLPDHQKKILVLVDWFEPGYKAGGPIRSCLHFVQQLKDNYRIVVFTSDRDLNADRPYENVVTDKWISFESGVDIFYCSPKLLSWKHILQQIRMYDPEYIYINSMYSRYFAVYPILMRRLGLIRQKLILSPRGMLKASALQFIKTKKKIFLTLLRWAGVHHLVYFHATDQAEQNDIRKKFGERVTVTIAPNLGAAVDKYPAALAKRPQELSIAFIGRLHPIKNLDYLLQLLPSIIGQISLTVVGSEENKSYVAHCKDLAARLPERIIVRFIGELPNRQLPGILSQHHIFALPTQGENFGHAIFEALTAGKPVLISDQTPWQNLQSKKAGWAINLMEKEGFVKALQQVADFDQQQYNEWSVGAWQLASDFAKQPHIKDLYKNIFR
jgi:glycosyltransferase involved in cell wall biosynthesis